MSNPSLPSAPVPPPMGAVAGAASSASPLRLAAARYTDDDDDALEEGELRVPVPVPVPVPEGHESFDDSDDTEDDDVDGRMSYDLIQPRAVEYNPYAVEYNPYVFRRPQHRRSPRRHRLDALDILLLGPGAGDALPSPTPSDDECESDSTLSDHGVLGGNDPTGSSSTSGAAPPSSAAATAAADAVGLGWAATGKRGWKAGGKHAAAEVVQEQEVFDLNTVSAATGEDQAGTTNITSAQAAPADNNQQQQPPHLPAQAAAQPPRAPQQPPRRKRERATEYTCKECGKSYPNNQALGGHAAGHRNKRREAEAMAAAMAAAVAAGVGDGDAAAAFLPIRRSGGGKAAGEPHECRKCGKVFASGVALGGHMRVHYTGKPIVPNRKNKKRCLAPLPPPTGAAEGDVVDAAVEVGLSLALSIKAEDNIAVKAEDNIAVAAPPAAAAAAAAGLSLALALSIKTEQESPPPPPPAVPARAVSAVLLFGRNISAPPPLQQQQAPLQQGSGGMTAKYSLSTGQQQH